ncbi:sortase-like acyltransferase [Saccharomonospora marina XMU15]|uniref:Sortase-like acyltransferase n=1 Tax=Saccharomonospora marina XMU15 TaxID=882083 RepID=H5X949_9PSEU|nr:GNAT family N-acetyltransferase [Saccharomonospora marina]EHR53652.1 sortase-like acyltransferase [Saccharomonospora marina XMU15]
MSLSPIAKNGSGPAVRAATDSDLPAIADIYGYYVTNSVATFELQPPEHAEWLRRYRAITAAGLPFLVAEHPDLAGTVAGYACCTPWKARPAYRHTAEDSVYLDPQARGRGIGGALLDRLLAGCVEASVRQVLAVIADSGDPSSTALHTGRGFAEVGRLREVGFKHGRWLDTVLLQRTLTGQA